MGRLEMDEIMDIGHAFNEANKGRSPEEHVRVWTTIPEKTFLIFGGSRHSSEIFRSYRDRDPSIQSFVSLFKLKK